MSDAPILAVECNEKGTLVTREVRLLSLTRANLHKFWLASKQYPILLNQEIRGNFERFVNIFLEQDSNGITPRGILYVIDDFLGVMFLTNIDVINNSAEAHFSFFDGRIHGRDKLAKELVKYVFNFYGFNRLTANVPAYVPSHTLAFAKRVGFKIEGRAKQAAYNHDHYFDVTNLALLKSEVEEWALKSEQSAETVEQSDSELI